MATSQPRRKFDWDEPCPQGGRITNIYVLTQQVGRLLTCRSRIHEEMFRGAIGKPKERLRSNPRKNRNQSTEQRVPSSHKSQLRLCLIKERADPRTTSKKPT